MIHGGLSLNPCVKLDLFPRDKSGDTQIKHFHSTRSLPDNKKKQKLIGLYVFSVS